ncbi:MAG: glycosyltransferase family 2 protein [Candidatus Diapherotrites archaeon]
MAVKAENPLVSIVVLNWNGKELLRNCLKSLRENTNYAPYEVIVVDNASSDGSTEMVKKEFSWAKLIENKENRGFAGGNNDGIRQSKGEFVLLLNNDTLIKQSDWLDEMVKAMQRHPLVGILGPRLVFGDGSVQQIKGAEAEKIVKTVSGAAFLIRQKVLDEIGLLDEGFNPIYYEETDFSERTRRKGFLVMYTPKATITHLEGATTGQKKFSKWKYFLAKKNRLRFQLLNEPLWALVFVLPFEFCISVVSAARRNAFKELFSAYAENRKNLGEIMEKRRER